MRLWPLICCFVLGGCAVVATGDARTEYQASSAQYKTCLQANAASPQNCEGLRMAMETDERKYNNLSAGMNGNQSSSNLTVQRR